MRILLVEDNVTIAHNIQDFCAMEQLTVDCAYDGEQWREMVQQYHYDLLIIDWMLPKMNGIELCNKIRTNSNIPLIMLTAKGELSDKLEGFDRGFDDYLVKPFDLDELVARIRALYKRAVGNSEEFAYGDIVVQLETRRVMKGGEEVNLTIKEFYILEYLIRHRGLPVSRADVVEYVRWGDSLFENTDKLDVYIANLRRKLDRELIQTLKGFGYKIEK